MQIGIVAAIAILGVTLLVAFGNPPSAAPAPVASVAGIRVSGESMGDAAAPVTIEEWGDFQCPVCGAFARTIEPQLRATYVATGKVRFVFRNMAFLGQESLWAAAAAACAGDDGRFFDFHDRLYALQGAENNGTFTKPNLLKIGHDLGLSVTFDACVTSDRYLQRVREDTQAGQQKGVTATPTFFVNGRKVTGVQSLDQLRVIIDPLIK
jgi:protein-disulfide isomerase